MGVEVKATAMRPLLMQCEKQRECNCVKGRRVVAPEKMRPFDPWPVFFKREWKRNWPFLVGFAITGTIITKYSLSLTGKSLSVLVSD